MDVSVILGVLAILIFYILWRNASRKNIPPGPSGLPIVGYMPYLSKRPYLDFQKLAKTYGDIFSVQFGSRFVVVLNDFESTKDAFATDTFMGRPKSLPFEFSKKSYETEAFFGMPWKEQRRFCLHMLKDLGLGRSKMETHMREEVCEVLEHFERKEGEPVAITKVLAPSMSNNITSLVFGKSLKYDDPLRVKMDNWVSEVVNAADQVGWHLFFPVLNKIMKTLKLGNYKKMAKVYSELKGFIRKEMEEHEKTLDPNNVRDFIDGYLLEIKKQKNDFFQKDVLEDMVAMFFAAGSETVRVTLEWLLLTMSTYRDVQRKVQEEIDEVLGKVRFPVWTDNMKMPYTMAVIYELMRWISIVPINIIRFTLSDTTLHGYDIPKKTYVLSNLFAIHNDVEYWGEDVKEFRPERLLTEDGKALKKVDRLIPFSIGKRACPGEPMAKMEVFIYFVSILQKFDVRLPEGKSANFEGILGATLRPHPQELIFMKRD